MIDGNLLQTAHRSFYLNSRVTVKLMVNLYTNIMIWFISNALTKPLHKWLQKRKWYSLLILTYMYARKKPLHFLEKTSGFFHLIFFP